MEALGLIETFGLVPAIEAADAAVKAANVKLQSLQIVKGGLVTVSLYGDVGAVKAAVDAGSCAASKLGSVLASHVIPRIESNVDKVLFGKKAVAAVSPSVSKSTSVSSPNTVGTTVKDDTRSKNGK